MRETPTCVLTLDEAGDIQFCVQFSGRVPHWKMGGFHSIEAALNWIDPWRERIWENPSDADESKVLISHAYRPGTVAESMRGR